MRYICTAVVATLALAGTSFAATINVPDDQPTIAAAISASVNGDVINIAAGTYNEHSLNTGGKAITIGSASGNLDVTIDAQQGGSVFMINSGEGPGTVIKDLVITGGTGTNLGVTFGGGIFCNNSNPTISGCTIEGNTASGGGGGIWCWNNSNPTITNCTIEDNTANGGGGGISCYNNSNPTITNCTIEDNTASLGGGGISCEQSNPTITNCVIESNEALLSDGGGGIYCQNSNPTISGCTIEGNTANNSGGGIACYSDSNPTISGCTFTSNMPDTIVGDFNTGEPAPPTGACCVSSGCHNLTETACAGMGGTWLGEGGLCEHCPAPCIADIVVNDQVDIHDLLYLLKQWGPCP